MNGFCPNCEKETQVIQVRKMEDFNVRGEIIPVEVEFYQCTECQEEFENTQSTIDPYEAAYRAYRSRKSMLQPEEIRALRNRYGLTQKEFSDLLGIGIATINRYENGALQSEAHDRLLRMAMQPRYFLDLLANHPERLEESKVRKIVDQLREETQGSWLQTTKDTFGGYSPDIYSGFKRFDLEKFYEAIKYFCYEERVFKTKLMKLLFYADFIHFKDYTVSITGARYARLPYGPVPDQFETWLAALLMEEEGVTKEEEWKNEYPGEIFSCQVPPQLSIFSPSELKVLAAVKEHFQDYSAKKLSDRSHSEKGYRETQNAALIPYSYSADLTVEFGNSR